MRKQAIYFTGMLAGTALLISCRDVRNSAPIEVRDTIPQKAQPLNHLDNPALMYGTSLGNLIQSLYRNNRYIDLVAFTDCQRFGTGAVDRFYRSGRFGLDFTLDRLSNMYMERDTIFLTYANASVYGTRRKIVLKCRVINDTAKLLLPFIYKVFTGR